jgi:propanol-preferring alcohol dehydrogenase
VSKVGDNVKGLEVGQRVVPHLFFTCGECDYCLAGKDPQCTKLGGLIGVTVDGAFAEYFKAPERNLFVLPDSIPFEIGGLISCAMVTAIQAHRKAGPHPGDSAIIVGAGGVGQVLIQLLRASGVRVVAISRSEDKLEIARSLGADLAIQADDPNIEEKVRTFSDQDGADCVFDCVGSSVTMGRSANYVANCGRIIVIGEEEEYPEIDTVQIAQRELEIIGTRNGTRKDTEEAISLVERGILKPQIARTFPLEQVNEALDFMESGQSSGRVVIVFEK